MPGRQGAGEGGEILTSVTLFESKSSLQCTRILILVHIWRTYSNRFVLYTVHIHIILHHILYVYCPRPIPRYCPKLYFFMCIPEMSPKTLQQSTQSARDGFHTLHKGMSLNFKINSVKFRVMLLWINSLWGRCCVITQCNYAKHE